MSLCAQVDGLNHALFLCEVKTMAYMLQESSHLDPDFIKLMNIMKDELDNIKSLDSDSNCLLSFGPRYIYPTKRHYLDIYCVACISFTIGDMCQLYAMDFKYHKLYRLLLLNQSHLPIDKCHTQRLESCYHAMLRLEVS